MGCRGTVGCDQGAFSCVRGVEIKVNATQWAVSVRLTQNDGHLSVERNAVPHFRSTVAIGIDGFLQQRPKNLFAVAGRLFQTDHVSVVTSKSSAQLRFKGFNGEVHGWKNRPAGIDVKAPAMTAKSALQGPISADWDFAIPAHRWSATHRRPLAPRFLRDKTRGWSRVGPPNTNGWNQRFPRQFPLHPCE